MLYALYVHVGDTKRAHGVTFPDFPGCFASADEWNDLPGAVQEAVEAHFSDGDENLPEPTPLDRLAHAPQYEGGVWRLFDIDLSRHREPLRRVIAD